MSNFKKYHPDEMKWTDSSSPSYVNTLSNVFENVAVWRAPDGPNDENYGRTDQQLYLANKNNRYEGRFNGSSICSESLSTSSMDCEMLNVSMFASLLCAVISNAFIYDSEGNELDIKKTSECNSVVESLSSRTGHLVTVFSQPGALTGQGKVYVGGFGIKGNGNALEVNDVPFTEHDSGVPFMLNLYSQSIIVVPSQDAGLVSVNSIPVTSPSVIQITSDTSIVLNGGQAEEPQDSGQSGQADGINQY